MAPSKPLISEFTVLENHWDTIIVLNLAKCAISKDRPKPPTEISVKVSSKHLIVASPVLAALLNGKFREGHELQMTGTTEIALPDDNPDIMVALLNIIHGFPGKVPRHLNLEALLEVAVLVDKYQLLESVELFLETWLKKVHPAERITRFSDRVTYWICIGHAFQKPSLLKPMMATAKYMFKGPLNTLGLPIPKSIVGKEKSRLTITG
ncbi:hypothetical protein AJ80_07631 [Polytolypa hystricis UAMH7299]|uniref:BTB domain-containing protein n=1 Tax=Polytolypa hystricis (strain UAMH7299) TaxID=1447883 RepID=A0A2B7XL69_POLH7|nr:hypothetical protein AJ80_07631 [Polytolypa hystricis UAMH7299]